MLIPIFFHTCRWRTIGSREWLLQKDGYLTRPPDRTFWCIFGGELCSWQKFRRPLSRHSRVRHSKHSPNSRCSYSSSYLGNYSTEKWTHCGRRYCASQTWIWTAVSFSAECRMESSRWFNASCPRCSSKRRQAEAVAIQIPNALEHHFPHLLTYNIHVYDFIGITLHNKIESDVLMLTEVVT